ncbi:hypothetical protein KIN20_035520 [Parelaphostrongylus tenuis]|uniref:Uncharacterized protein n=1 Tax=Parelaphostrongylus tenuis TaxID=148309 RepID=A0AAD5WKX1_PARTN|nr:hypothetical protein KIN20_035520 [Parelaphostrongylus tenuis]
MAAIKEELEEWKETAILREKALAEAQIRCDFLIAQLLSKANQESSDQQPHDVVMHDILTQLWGELDSGETVEEVPNFNSRITYLKLVIIAALQEILEAGGNEWTVKLRATRANYIVNIIPVKIVQSIYGVDHHKNELRGGALVLSLHLTTRTLVTTVRPQYPKALLDVWRENRRATFASCIMIEITVIVQLS